MVLLDSHTGIVKAMRVITYSTHMSQLFQRLLMRQLQNGMSPEQHAQSVKDTYSLYPHSRDMVKAALCTERAGLIQPAITTTRGELLLARRRRHPSAPSPTASASDLT